MKKILSTTLFFIAVVFCNAQNTTRLKNNFNEPVNPYEYLLETYRGMHPEEFKGKLKTASIKETIEYPEQIIDISTIHYYNNNKHAYTIEHAIKKDNDNDILEHTKDTIYPEKTPQKLKDVITPENEIRYVYNKLDQLSELRAYQVIRGANENSSVVKKINNSVKQVTYNKSGMAAQVKIFFYEAAHQLLSENEINYTYTAKALVSEIKTIYKSYEISNFKHHKSLLVQEWLKKELTSTATTLQTFKYAADMLVSGIYKDEYDAKKYHITHKNDSVIIEHMPLKGAKKKMHLGKYEVLLDSHKNPLKMIEYQRMENGELEPTGGESFTITYEYY